MRNWPRFFSTLSAIFFASASFADNPFIQDQFTADPSARVFGGKVYVYPSHDIDRREGKGREDWFAMEDYHVFSSSNLFDWIDHGVIVSQRNVAWVDASSYSMWAPDCIFRNGKYYFYFPARPKDTGERRGSRIGVAISNTPYGPFTPQSEPIANVRGIDPNIFIDQDGQAYLYWSARDIFAAKLKENMLELDSEVHILEDLPDEGLKEGPYVIERNGIYYLTYPHVENNTERLEYAIGDNPMGPFKVTGVIMDEHPSGCWTNHHSVIEFEGQWYLFYHHNDLSPAFDKNRSIRVDKLYFNEDGTIQKVTPTLRGVGAIRASRQIQIDRYSQISDSLTTVTLLNADHPFEGWKSTLKEQNAWIQYNDVDFGSGKYKKVEINALAQSGGSTIQIRLDHANGPIICEKKIPKRNKWKTFESRLSEYHPGVHNVVVVLKDHQPLEIDWIRFKK